MKNRQYHGVQLSKKESELIEFLLTGSNDYQKAFYIYKHRSRKIETDRRKIQSWFNSTLKKLQQKSIALNIPFVLSGMWVNPGIEASKANLVMEQRVDEMRELNAFKPVI